MHLAPIKTCLLYSFMVWRNCISSMVTCSCSRGTPTPSSPAGVWLLLLLSESWHYGVPLFQSAGISSCPMMVFNRDLLQNLHHPTVCYTFPALLQLFFFKIASLALSLSIRMLPSSLVIRPPSSISWPSASQKNCIHHYNSLTCHQSLLFGSCALHSDLPDEQFTAGLLTLSASTSDDFHHLKLTSFSYVTLSTEQGCTSAFTISPHHSSHVHTLRPSPNLLHSPPSPPSLPLPETVYTFLLTFAVCTVTLLCKRHNM